MMARLGPRLDPVAAPRAQRHHDMRDAEAFDRGVQRLLQLPRLDLVEHEKVEMRPHRAHGLGIEGRGGIGHCEALGAGLRRRLGLQRRLVLGDEEIPGAAPCRACFTASGSMSRLAPGQSVIAFSPFASTVMMA